MRPHLYFLWNVWNCRSFHNDRMILGIGWDIHEAYGEWKKQHQLCQRGAAA